MQEIFTIGYSAFSLGSFIRALKKHQINAVADVRSLPYSGFKPEFNRENLQSVLKEHGIAYVFLGDSCGARIDDPSCFTHGKADFRLIARHPRFIEGLNRIRKGMAKYHLALMCAEKDPLNCHRAILIIRNLKSNSIKINHIMSDLSLEDHRMTEKRLLSLYNLEQPDLFKTEHERIEQAYDLQARKIAYSENEQRDGDTLEGDAKNVD